MKDKREGEKKEKIHTLIYPLGGLCCGRVVLGRWRLDHQPLMKDTPVG